MTFLNYQKITVSKEYKATVMDLMLKNNLYYKKCDILENLSLEITISPRNAEKFKKILESNSVEFILGEARGISRLIERYKKRYGIFIGVFILILSLYASSLFVWRIDITGNNEIASSEITQALERCGFSLGSFIPSINYDELHNNFLLNSKDISWISVNITGNVARVVVRERFVENNNNCKTYSNVISKYDAQISEIQIYNGKKVVSIGDVVKKGDILVTGIMNSQSQGTRYVNANAKIMGYVNKPIFIKAPYLSTKKIYLDHIEEEKYIKIFSKTINFSLKGRNYGEFYDKIETSKKLTLFGIIELPIEISTCVYRPYEIQKTIYDTEQIVDIAFSELRKQLDIATKNAELIEKEIKTYYDEEGFYIDCSLYCLENIASIVEFEVKNEE